MKRFFLLLLVAGFAGSIFAADFKSVIITTSALTINVPDDHILHIRNFTQEGGTERGVVTVKINNQTANVLNAAIIDNTAVTSPAATPSPTGPPEIINQIVIAGPATVTVPPIPGATLFISFRKEQD
jgi:hypothetical protein